MATQRFESSVTAVSWIPSEAISGPSKIPFELGVTHYDEPPPDRLEDLEELRTSDRFREANELRGVHRGRGRPDRGRRPLGQGPHRRDDRPRRTGGPAVPGGPPARTSRPEPEVGAIVRPLRPDGRRPDGPADAAAGAAQAVRPVLAVDRLDDARPDDQRRRQLEPRARRREPVPAPLDLRPRGPARREVGRDRLRQVVQRLVRRADAVGRAGLAGGGGRGRVGARAVAVERDHARRREAEDPQDRRGRDARAAGRAPAPRSS